MEDFSSDYRDYFSGITYSEFGDMFLYWLIVRYVLEVCPEILAEEGFTDFKADEYKKYKEDQPIEGGFENNLEEDIS